MAAESGRSRTVRVDALSRVEGEGALTIRLRNGRVAAVRLEIYEPPRLFEAMLRGRSHLEPVDMTARICGICPVAYQTSAAQAIEDACGVEVPAEVRRLRRLIYCGEWIESHTLHIYLLHAPDFLGYDGAIEMAADHPGVVDRGLQLKKTGNRIVEVVGGRAIHPVNPRVGGFHRAPRRDEVRGLVDGLERAADAAVETVRWVAGFEFPDQRSEGELVALAHPDEYPICEGRIRSTAGLDVPVAGFLDHFEEEQVRHSNALHARRRGDERGPAYVVGPIARYSLNFDRLSPEVRELAAEVGLGPSCRNQYQSIVVRGLEVLEACLEALRIARGYEEPDQPAVEVEPRAGVGHGCSEAPRGLLYHRYRLAADGTVEDAVIVPPTSQNQAAIESDLLELASRRLELPDAELAAECERVIRNYDPCISCATHFLQVRRVGS